MFGFNSATWYLVYCLAACVFLFYVIFIYTNLRLLKFSWQINGFFMPILPLVGTAYVSLLTGEKINILATVEWLHNVFGFPCNAWMGRHYLYFSTNPKEIKVILNHPKCIDKMLPMYDTFDIFSKQCLFLLSYDKWRLRRKHFQKSYRPKVLKSYQPIFFKQSCELLNDLAKIPSKADLFEFFNKYSFRNFFLTSVGLEEDKIDITKIDKFGSLLDELQALASKKLMDPVTPVHVWAKVFPNGRKTIKYIEIVRQIVLQILEDKKKQYAEFSAYMENTNELPLMDSMLNVNGKSMTDEEIFEEMVFFAAAATETSGHVMTFCFTLLGMNSDVQEKVYHEVMTVIGHRNISNEDIQNLVYTEAVILETLRLFPALPFVGRYVQEDMDVGDKVIPQATNFIINIYHLHRDAKYWPNPLQFDPSRFLPENAEKMIPYAYLPFSGGSRDCIGKVQAMILMKTTLANVIRNYKISSNFKSVDEIRLTSCLTMKATNPIDCRFIPR